LLRILKSEDLVWIACSVLFAALFALNWYGSTTRDFGYRSYVPDLSFLFFAIPMYGTLYLTRKKAFIAWPLIIVLAFLTLEMTRAWWLGQLYVDGQHGCAECEALFGLCFVLSPIWIIAALIGWGMTLNDQLAREKATAENRES